jgi:hypothetical protein
VKEGMQLLLELLGWGIAGVRSVVADSRRERREQKAKARSAQREADLLKRFAWPLCACTHEQREHVAVGEQWPCKRCGCMHFRGTVRR